jgi:chromosome segregation ATPase
MSILDKIAEDEKALEELNKEQEDGNIEENTGAEETDEPEDGTAEPSDDGEQAEEASEGDTEESGESEEVADEETSEEEPKDNRGYARLRREKAEAERKAREYEERLKALEAKVTNPETKAEEKDPEPDVKKDPVAWLEWNDRQNKTEIAQLKESIQKEQQAKQEAELIERAKQEFTSFESQFAASVDDYEDVAQFMFKKVADSLSVVNPNLTQAQLIDKTQRHILQLAADYHAQGLNPAEELYYDAKEKFGFQSAPKEEVKKEPARRDLSKIASNRKRNAGTAVVSGGSKPQITKEMAANMSISEFAQLSEEDKKAIGI